MTPCEKLGYKVGDEFVYTGSKWFKSQSICTLHFDDGTYQPKFLGAMPSGRKETMWIKLSDVKPI